MNIRVLRVSILLLMIFILTGRIFKTIQKPIHYPEPFGEGGHFEFEGFVFREPVLKDKYQRVPVLVQSVTDKEKDIGINVKADKFLKIKYGDVVRVSGNLSIPKDKGYVNYLSVDDILYEVSYPKVEILNKRTGGKVTTILFDLKRSFMENIQRVLDEPHASLAGGLVLGEKNSLGKELLDSFRHAGLMHIIVLSGFNITIIAEGLMAMLYFLPKNIRLFTGGAGMILFSIMVGGGTTVIRSVLMAIIAIAAQYARREYKAGFGIFMACILMGIWSPRSFLFDPSFHLSFLATFAMIFVAPYIEKIIKNKASFVTERFEFRSIIASTIGTQIVVTPYIVYLVGDVSLWGLITNIFILPIIPLTMLFVFLTGMFGYISTTLSFAPAFFANILLSYELFIVQLF